MSITIISLIVEENERDNETKGEVMSALEYDGFKVIKYSQLRMDSFPAILVTVAIEDNPNAEIDPVTSAEGHLTLEGWRVLDFDSITL